MNKLVLIFFLLFPVVAFANANISRDLQTKLDNFVCAELARTKNHTIFWERIIDSFRTKVANKETYDAELIVYQDRAELEITANGNQETYITKNKSSDTYISKSKCVTELYLLLSNSRLKHLEQFFKDHGE